MREDQPPPSGHQYVITYGSARATVVEVGGGIREYTVDGRAVLDPYPVEEMADGARGQHLVPWPNRLDGGRYRFDGSEHQLPLTEAAAGNAIHGLMRWRPWQAVRHDDALVVLRARLHPMPGYPFTLEVEVEYRLDADGLAVTTTATNRGTLRCPYGHGQHPYLSPGVGTLTGARLTLDAGTRILTDADRGLPVGRETTRGTAFDFRGGVDVGELRIDSAFTDLAADPAGRAWALLAGLDGATAAVWVDGSYPYLQLYTGDTLAPARRRRGLACEPTTCPPNAFASGQDVIRLEPGGSHTCRWGAQLR